jgi:hypothetical protein
MGWTSGTHYWNYDMQIFNYREKKDLGDTGVNGMKILWHVEPLQGNEHERSDYTTATAQ